jgi:hypothetical protein
MELQRSIQNTSYRQAFMLWVLHQNIHSPASKQYSLYMLLVSMCISDQSIFCMYHSSLIPRHWKKIWIKYCWKKITWGCWKEEEEEGGLYSALTRSQPSSLGFRHSSYIESPVVQYWKNGDLSVSQKWKRGPIVVLGTFSRNCFFCSQKETTLMVNL